LGELFRQQQDPVRLRPRLPAEESFKDMPAQVQTYVKLVDGSGAEAAKMDEVVDLKKSNRGGT